MKVRRKDSGKSWCQHALVACEDCQEEYMERDLQDHRSKQCNRRETSCPNCSTQLLYRELEGHLNLCPEATFPCTAALYGCDFISKREPLDQHQATCPIRKLVPFLEIQKLRLEDHEATLQHIRRKNSLLETSFANIQEVLGSSTSLDDPPPSSLSISTAPAPFDSTAAHLISLHESLREEVERVKAAVSELDAKASMMVMNESLRIKEDMAHMNAALSNTRMQVQWLMSSRLQNQQRAAMNRTQSSGEGGVSVLVGAASSSSAAGTGSGTGTGTAMLGQPVRRLSDSTRQETKL
ncbi:hypothetical protein MMC24_000117 [Lignoscripta atroalba]|nr:hypothetical protein [Lignoscripta atroalba]